MFNIDKYRQNSGKISRSKIATDITSRMLKKNDIDEMLKCQEVRDAFLLNNISFTPMEDSLQWDRDYLNDLKLKAAAEIFNEEYLFHLEEVAAYIATKHSNPSVFKKHSIIPLWGIGAIATCVVLAASTVFFVLGGMDRNDTAPVPSAITKTNIDALSNEERSNVEEHSTVYYDATKSDNPSISENTQNETNDHHHISEDHNPNVETTKNVLNNHQGVVSYGYVRKIDEYIKYIKEACVKCLQMIL